MPEYSDAESVSSSESESESDCEQIEAVLKKVPKAKVPDVKPTEISIPKKKREKNVIVKEIHHYHDAKPVAPPPAPAPKQPKQVRPPKPPAMVFA